MDARTATAPGHWDSLTEHQPVLAAELCAHLQTLPADTPQRLIAGTTTQDALYLPTDYVPAGPVPAPDIAPYNADDVEDCAACSDTWDSCRYHYGHATGYGDLLDLLAAAVKNDPAITVTDALAAINRRYQYAA
ncbi:hypothetical protein [Streptomyces sp. NPDC047315]|uniref:hypothetical protein n=1 Tax=Streptomyces sp. NPDC047315 TaxID=3155142 RepID=UPI0033D5A0CA